MDTQTEFREAMCAFGLCPPEQIEPGRWVRFPGVNKGPRNRAGWCKLFEDGLAGCFGDYSTGLSESWHARSLDYLKRSKPQYRKQIEAAREQARLDQKSREDTAAFRAREIWSASEPAEAQHPYLKLKRIPPLLSRRYKGNLLLPVYDFSPSLVSLQFIDANGNKRLLSCGRKRGCFIPVWAGQKPISRIIICEGWSTGATLAEEEPGSRVISAIDAGNLTRVANSSRGLWPDTELVIAGDDDRQTPGNPGATKAAAAARAADALLAMPKWPADAPPNLSDFNDLACWRAERQ